MISPFLQVTSEAMQCAQEAILQEMIETFVCFILGQTSRLHMFRLLHGGGCHMGLVVFIILQGTNLPKRATGKTCICSHKKPKLSNR